MTGSEPQRSSAEGSVSATCSTGYADSASTGIASVSVPCRNASASSAQSSSITPAEKSSLPAPYQEKYASGP